MATRDVSTSTDDSQRCLESRFFEALKNNDAETVGSMLTNGPFYDSLKAADKLALAFVQAVLLNNVDLVDILVSHGADITEADYMFEENGAMHAARYGHTEMLSYLVSAGVGVNNQSGKSGCTALHIAVENGKHECVKALVQLPGIDVDVEDHSGCSPLLWAAKLRDWRTIQILIDAGCHVLVRKNNAETALHVAVDNKQAFWKGKRVGPDDIVQCINLLVDSGIDINTCDNNGMPPLIYAINSDNTPAVKHLLKLNCDIPCKTIMSVSSSNSPVFHFPKLSNSEANIVYGRDQHILQELLPVYLAISKLQLAAVKTLCLSGARYHQLASEPAVMAYIGHSKMMQECLADVISTPMDLKASSRNEIRRLLGRGVMTKVRQLDLPETLKEYLCLNELEDV